MTSKPLLILFQLVLPICLSQITLQFYPELPLYDRTNYTGDPFALPQKINFTAKCCVRTGIDHHGEYENLIFDLKTRLHDPLNGLFTEKKINDGQGFELCQSKHFIIYSNTSNEIFCTGHFKNSLRTEQIIDIKTKFPAVSFADEIHPENAEMAKISNVPFSLCSDSLKSYPIELLVSRGTFEKTQLFGYQKSSDSPILFNDSLPSIKKFLKPYLVVRNSNIQFDLNMNSTIFPSLPEHMFIACRRKPIPCLYKNKKICNSSRFTGVLWKEFMTETTEILDNKQLCERKHKFVETIIENVKHKYLECQLNAAYIPERNNLLIEKRWYADGKIFKTGDLNLREVDDLKTVTCSIALFHKGVDKIQLCEGFHTENYTISKIRFADFFRRNEAKSYIKYATVAITIISFSVLLVALMIYRINSRFQEKFDPHSKDVLLHSP